jgi:5-methylcytosine-specific restriction endonuclease McrA
MVSKKQKDDIKRDQDWKCALCGASIKHGGHIHHKDRDKTNNSLSNLIAVCAKCHHKITPTRKPKSKIRFLTDKKQW